MKFYVLGVLAGICIDVFVLRFSIEICFWTLVMSLALGLWWAE